MMEMTPQQIGKWLIVAGLVTAAIGVLLVLLGRLGQFRLPGDLEFGGRNWKVYFPVGTCILISVILTVILWVIHHFRR